MQISVFVDFLKLYFILFFFFFFFFVCLFDYENLMAVHNEDIPDVWVIVGVFGGGITHTIPYIEN
ncbi:hypothetical protein KUTeg_023782 [Tegillarca granosa]|uniref:Uncharacterized protein n=1 Tax=Tegillarca granosa TaxID=220873 RepID=A0ABQ9E371_TEGGR|nr:hypothetical protein KUTeg_023782 [Tegillarca granosa]